MPVELSVHDVREALRRQAGRSWEAARPSNLILGRMFHQVLADLIGPGPNRNGFTVLEATDEDRKTWGEALRRHAYLRLIGPRLVSEQSRLHDAAGQVLDFWQAAVNLVEWLADLAWTCRHPTPGRRPLDWPALRALIRPEVPAAAELHLPGWTDSVRMAGVADSLLVSPNNGAWCVIELKLGRTSPEADLAQACLYRLLLTKIEEGNRDGPSAEDIRKRDLALVSFKPDKEEILLNSAQATQADDRLIDLIGSLAGVWPKETKPPARPASRYLDLGQKIIEVFEEYGRSVGLVEEPVVGPAFLRYRLTLGAGVRLKHIQDLDKEIQIRLALPEAPLIGLVEGRVCLDLGRPDRQVVYFDAVKERLPEIEPLAGSALVIVGLDLDGNLKTADLSDPLQAHIMVAGSPGSGKSEWLRAAIAGLIMCNTPETLRLVLIDPKRTAFNDLADSPYFFSPSSLIFPDEQLASVVLAELASEMDNRYRLLQENGVDDQAALVKKTGRPCPRVVCLCDEYASLVTGDRGERQAVESLIRLIGNKARAAGIHLILATQQPSRQVISGAVQASIPCRVGLKMNDSRESYMLLQQTGAEKLLGHGDLLFKDLGDPVRLQAPFLPEEQRKALFTSKAGAVHGGRRAKRKSK
ncbi:MAG: DNA translocase FtsK [Thermodesulfobacteriota bacterium]